METIAGLLAVAGRPERYFDGCRIRTVSSMLVDDQADTVVVIRVL
jgi:hypothetical protein